MLTLPWLRHLFVFVTWALVSTAAMATAYTFPGSMPAGCAGAAGIYTCGAVILNDVDTVTINAPKPATITFLSLDTHGADINAAGVVSDLTIIVTGTMFNSAGAIVKANVTAGNIAGSGAASYGGSLTTTGSGYINIGSGSTVPGAITSTSGVVTLFGSTAGTYTTVGSISTAGIVHLYNYNHVTGSVTGYLVDASGNANVGGNITSNNTYVSLGGYAAVGGSISSQTYVDTGSYSNITGSISAATQYIDTGLTSTVGGNLTAGGTYIDIHSNAVIGGSMTAASYINIVGNSTVAGSATAGTHVFVYSGATVAQCARSTGAGTIFNNSGSTIGGVCCGSGATCTNTCVAFSPKPSACQILHHLELTTASGTVTANNNVVYTIKACQDAACSSLYTWGVTGTLSISGVTPTYTTGASFAIPSGSSSTTETVQMTSGTATAALSSPSPTPTNSPAVFCGMGGAAGSGNSCSVTVTPALHHLEVTTASATAVSGNNVVFTVKACTDTASPCTAYTAGVTGTLAISGVTPTFPSGAVFSIAASSSSTTVTASMTAGTATASVTSPSPTPSNTPTYFCGMGATAGSGNTCNLTIASALHHLEVTTSVASGLTCAATDFTIKACVDAASPCAAATSGVTGNLVLTGTGGSTTAFTINSGSSTVIVTKQITKAGTVVASITSPSPTPSNSPATFCGMGVAASSGGTCNFTTNTSALRFINLNDHVADVQQTGVQLQAVKSTSDNSACVPGFTGSKSIAFSCAFTIPASGSKAVVVGSAISLACGAGSAGATQPLSLTFDGTGTATTTLQYADVGKVQLLASYTGTAGVDSDASGSAYFIAKPAKFSVTGVTAAPITAGNTFSATVNALNNSGALTPNFGKETPSTTDYVRVAFTKTLPAGGVAGTFTGTGTSASTPLGSSSFNAGSATVSDLKWDEVGAGTLTASLVGPNYQTVATTATTPAPTTAGPFIPAYLDVTRGGYAYSCATFTYSSQPFNLVVKARNSAGATTQNYSGTVVLAPVTAGTGTLTNASISSFTLGASPDTAATASSPTFTFTSKATPTTSMAFRGTDSTYYGGVTLTSLGHTEEAVTFRNGRLKLANAFGSDKVSTLRTLVQVQYLSSNGWVLASDDTCSASIPASAVVLVNGNYQRAGAVNWTTSPTGAVSISGGRGWLSFNAPSTAGGTGSVDYAINLGTGTATDTSCLANHASTAGAGMPWLRSVNGTSNSCSSASNTNSAFDPSARATFGVFSSESKKTIYERDLF